MFPELDSGLPELKKQLICQWVVCVPRAKLENIYVANGITQLVEAGSAVMVRMHLCQVDLQDPMRARW